MAFNRVGELVAQLIEAIPDDLTTAQQEEIARIASATGSSLSVVYGEADSIRFVMNGDSDTPFSVAHMLGLPAAIHQLRAAVPDSVWELARNEGRE